MKTKLNFRNLIFDLFDLKKVDFSLVRLKMRNWTPNLNSKFLFIQFFTWLSGMVIRNYQNFDVGNLASWFLKRGVMIIVVLDSVTLDIHLYFRIL